MTEFHTERCLRLQGEYKEYEKKWPNFHGKCGGTGIVTETWDPSPSGVSLGQGWYTETYPCSCTDNGICARCGRESLPYDIFTEQYTYCCMNCGFVVAMSGAPIVDCDCWRYDPGIQLHESAEHTRYRQHEFDTLGYDPL